MREFSGRGGRISSHPVDQLIRELIHTGREATPDEIDQIVERMATARFPSLSRHLAKHTEDELWAIRTTDQEYLDDIRHAVRDARARVLVYFRRGGNIAAVLSQTARIVPQTRRGPDWKATLYVVYSADRSIIVTGYQVSDLSTLTIPGDARWLR